MKTTILPRTFKTEAELLAFTESVRSERGGCVLHVLILHDNGCSQSRCVCSPWYEVREGTAENFIEGQRAQAQWLRETAS